MGREAASLQGGGNRDAWGVVTKAESFHRPCGASEGDPTQDEFLRPDSIYQSGPVISVGDDWDAGTWRHPGRR